MSNFIGSETKHLVIRERELDYGNENKETITEILNFNKYDSTFMFTSEVGQATLFDDNQKANQVKNALQNLNDLMGSGNEFKVVKQDVTRTIAEEE